MWDLNPAMTAEPKPGTLTWLATKDILGPCLLSPHLQASLWAALSPPDSHPQLSPGMGCGLV